MKLRHALLLPVREVARHATHLALVAETMTRVIQRSDELAELVAIYWKDGPAPLSGQVKKGLAAAFPKFDEYALAKYDRPGVVRLRDVPFLCHAKPLMPSRQRCGSGWSMVSWRLPIPGRWHSPRVAITIRIGSDCSQRKYGADERS
jgi:hypothetical protein